MTAIERHAKWKPQPESVADFKLRLSAMMRAAGVERKRTNPALVRKPTDRGYYPPPRRK